MNRKATVIGPLSKVFNYSIDFINKKTTPTSIETTWGAYTNSVYVMDLD